MFTWRIAVVAVVTLVGVTAVGFAQKGKLTLLPEGDD
jgi:hypothetical protein